MGVNMNPYAMLSSGIGTTQATSLSTRLAAWHDAMVAHERRLRSGRTSDACDDECPHVEARTLWAEAVDMFGPRASELAFLRSRALADAERDEEDVILRTDRASRTDARRSLRSSNQSATASAEL